MPADQLRHDLSGALAATRSRATHTAKRADVQPRGTVARSEEAKHLVSLRRQRATKGSVVNEAVVNEAGMNEAGVNEGETVVAGASATTASAISAQHRPPTSRARGQLHHIGAVAALTELSHATLRHWDEVGVVTPSGRSDGGFRLYSDDDVKRLLVIRRMKPLDFTLDEMRQLLECLDVLAQADSPPQLRDSAAQYLALCHQRAEESILRLRKRLAYAEELTEVLARAGGVSISREVGLGATAAIGEAPASR